MQIKQAEYKQSSKRVEECPQGADSRGRMMPEYAFIGRSNVGKSSLINMLTGRKRLALTSSTPGKTLLINHFLINGDWWIVDLPGYGYAQRGKQVRAELKRMIETYVRKRRQLTCLFVLLDLRLAPQANDLAFIRFLGEEGVPFALVFTKADKVKPVQRGVMVEQYRQVLLEEWEELPPLFITSAQTGEGREALLAYVEQVNEQVSSIPKC